MCGTGVGRRLGDTDLPTGVDKVGASVDIAGINSVGTLLGVMRGTAEGRTDEIMYGATIGIAVGAVLGP